MKKISFKKFLLNIDCDDETESVNWTDCEDQKTKFYNCGCCDECLCDDNIACDNCGCNCNCNCDDIDDDYDIEDDETDISESSEEPETLPTTKSQSSISNFDIHIIENKEKKKS